MKNQEELAEKREKAIITINKELKAVKLKIKKDGLEYKLIKQNAIDIIVKKNCDKYKLNTTFIKKIGRFEILSDVRN